MGNMCGFNMMTDWAQPQSSQAGAVGSVSLHAWRQLVQQGHHFTVDLADSIRQFWSLSLNIVFFGVSDQLQYFLKQDDFYVAELELAKKEQAGDESSTAVLRLSDALCEILLCNTLGSSKSLFSLSALSTLERKLIASFSRTLFFEIKEILLNSSLEDGVNLSNKDLVHFFWFVGTGSVLDQSKKREAGKIVLSVPWAALSVDVRESLKFQEEGVSEKRLIDDSTFFHVTEAITLHAGSAKLTLAEINLLEPDDMIVLDNSHSDQLLLSLESSHASMTAFQIRWSDAQKKWLTLHDEKDYIDMELPAAHDKEGSNNIWDNIQVSLTATLAPVQLPLKELKEISEGLVVELADVVDNQVTLHVEGRSIATGELLIVGERFGVRVNKVLAKQEEPAMNMSEDMIATAQSEETDSSSVESAVLTNETGEDEFDAVFDDDHDEDWS